MPPKGYRHLSVREEVYRRLEEFARNKGLAYPADAIPILLEYTDIYSKLEYLLQVRVKDLPQSGVTLPQTEVTTGTATGKTVPNPTTGASNPITSKPEPGTSEGYEWCRPKSSIKNLEGFVKYIERSLGLIDWWDEGDKYCFKTRKKPAKTE